MKLKILMFSAVAILSLVSCNQNSNSKIERSEIGESNITSDDSLFEESESTSKNEESSTAPLSEDTSSSINKDNLTELTIEFDNAKDFKAGTALDNTSNKGNLDKLIALANAKEEIISSISIDGYVGFKKYKDGNDIGLCLGSASMGGSMIFNFNRDIQYLEVNVQVYYQYVSYNSTWYIDNEADFFINNIEQDLGEIKENEATENKTYCVEQTLESVKFSCSDANKRIVIHSLLLKY